MKLGICIPHYGRPIEAYDAKLEIREAQHVALMERGIVDADLVGEGAVPAVEIAQAQAGGGDVDLGMLLRDGLVRQAQLEAGAASDSKRQLPDRESREAAIAARGALESPHWRRSTRDSGRDVSHDS